jgi:predicted acylesterase/phospholipase RssA
MEPSMLECDLVLKGGVTSGIVYPKAIVALARDYRFRSIGGTSAGAIAAAAAAAAEYRRQKSAAASFEGFDALSGLPDELGKPAAGASGSRLLALFQPQPSTRSLFKFLLSFLGTDRTETGEPAPKGILSKIATWLLIGRVCGRAIWHFPWYALLGALVALGFAWLLGVPFVSLRLPALVVLTLAAAIAFAFWGIWRAALKLPSNGFGLCRGFDRARDGSTHLTSWLHRMLQTTAGCAPAQLLTFGDLASVEIELRTVTTNLCYGHPHRLPFAAGEAWPFYCADEWRELFPADVLDHLEARRPSRLRDPQTEADRDYARAAARLAREQKLTPLPDAADLPVIVAVRLSLSFPLLLAAVPIYMLDPRDGASAPAKKCWFSDGGLSSNFPLHFFDTAIPVRPTFAINLQASEGAVPDASRVILPATNRDGLSRAWKGIDEKQPEPAVLAAFLLAIVDVMQNWRDNSLLRLPGYRDRVVSIALEPHEGGLNLSMPSPLIEKLAGYGERAAQQLALHFLPQNAARCAAVGIQTTWQNHRWVRLLSTLSALERLVEQLEPFWSATQGDSERYIDLLDPAITPEAPSYNHFSDAQRRLALDYLVQTRATLAACHDAIQAGSLTLNTPKPALHFRLTSES